MLSHRIYICQISIIFAKISTKIALKRLHWNGTVSEIAFSLFREESRTIPLIWKLHNHDLTRKSIRGKEEARLNETVERQVFIGGNQQGKGSIIIMFMFISSESVYRAESYVNRRAVSASVIYDHPWGQTTADLLSITFTWRSSHEERWDYELPW